MPPSLSPTNRGVANAGTFIAVIMVLVCAMALFLLVSMVTPALIGIILVPMALGPLAAFQYLAWGRWLSRLQAEDQARELAEKQATNGV